MRKMKRAISKVRIFYFCDHDISERLIKMMRSCCSSIDNEKDDDSSDDESLPDVFSSSTGELNTF
jgi:hypothetical protein